MGQDSLYRGFVQRLQARFQQSDWEAFQRAIVRHSEKPAQDIQQLWFAGVHSDVGGSYPEKESQLSKISLRWMLTEAQCAGLVVDSAQEALVLGARPPYVAPDPGGPIHESLRGAWWIAEFWPKIVRIQQPGLGNVWRRKARVNFGRRRYVADGSTMHISVEERMKLVDDYRPSNLCPPDEFRKHYRVVSDRSQPAESTRVFRMSDSSLPEVQY